MNAERVKKILAQIRRKGEAQREDRAQLIDAGVPPDEVAALLQREGLK